jgi:hypothetical protein
MSEDHKIFDQVYQENIIVNPTDTFKVPDGYMLVPCIICEKCSFKRPATSYEIVQCA